MKTVITGSRSLGSAKDAHGQLTPEAVEQTKWIHKILKDYFNMAGRTMINGCAAGVDDVCLKWAQERNKKFLSMPVECGSMIHLVEMPAEWNKYGKSAGFKRNAEMVAIGDNVLAFWDGKSRGTRHTIDQCLDAGKSVHVFVRR